MDVVSFSHVTCSVLGAAAFVIPATVAGKMLDTLTVSTHKTFSFRRCRPCFLEAWHAGIWAAAADSETEETIIKEKR